MSPTSHFLSHSSTVTSSPSFSVLPPTSVAPSSSSSQHPCLPLRRLSFQTQPLRSHNLLRDTHLRMIPKSKGLNVNCSINEPLKVMISGAPASGKGTQCELIVQKFGLVHLSTGDLLRAEVAAGTEIGNKAKEYMNAGRLVPDEIVTAMVTARLSREDAKQKGWLLDGYPRSFAQAQSLEKRKIRPDVYIVLDMCWEKARPSDWEDISYKKFSTRDGRSQIKAGHSS